MPLTQAAPQSIDRIFSILGHLARERDGESLSELARRADAPKSSVVGLLTGMVDSGYLIRDVQGKYRLGPNMVALAISVVARQGLQDLARPVLQRLADQTGETSLIGTLASDADLVMYVDKVESANPVRYTVPLGERRELYASAVGKVLLAHMAADRCDTYLRNEKLRAFTPKTITSVRTLRQEISEIRDAGLALTVDERVVGVSALAAPIHGEGGRVIAAIVIAGPSERMRTALKQHKASLRAAAKSLSLAMAGTTTH